VEDIQGKGSFGGGKMMMGCTGQTADIWKKKMIKANNTMRGKVRKDANGDDTR